MNDAITPEQPRTAGSDLFYHTHRQHDESCPDPCHPYLMSMAYRAGQQAQARPAAAWTATNAGDSDEQIREQWTRPAVASEGLRAALWDAHATEVSADDGVTTLFVGTVTEVAERIRAALGPAVASELRATENAREIALRYGREVTAQRDALLGLFIHGACHGTDHQCEWDEALRAALASDAASPAIEVEGLRAAADRLVHHYYCRLPTEGPEACPICSAIEDPDGRGTQTVLIDALAAALASDAGSVGALDVERLARALANVWKGLRWEHFTESQHLTDGELAAAIAAAYDAEGQGES